MQTPEPPNTMINFMEMTPVTTPITPVALANLKVTDFNIRMINNYSNNGECSQNIYFWLIIRPY